MSGLFAKMSRRLRHRRIYILPSASASMVSRYADGFRAGREHGYAAGLAAAREAVAAVPAMNATVDILTGQDVHEIWREDALAAIDALTEGEQT